MKFDIHLDILLLLLMMANYGRSVVVTMADLATAAASVALKKLLN